MSHYSRLAMLLKSSKVEEAKKEVQNLQMNMYLMLNEINTSTLTFSTMVQRVNKNQCNDISEEGLKRTIEMISRTGITIEDVERELDDVKKNSQLN